MKTTFKVFAIMWALGLVIVSIFAFAIAKLTAMAILGYIFILLAFVLELACAYYAFKEDNLQKVFYNMSLISVCFGGLIAMTIVGIIAMLLPVSLIWLGDIICLAIFAFTAIAIIKAQAAIEIVERIDEKVQTKTLFIKSLTVDAQTLLAQAKSDVAREECNKVFEAIRYSDPMSNDALVAAESQITIKFQELVAAVTAGDDNKISELANQVIVLVNDRNNKCKLLK